jgi:hypothetical protein
MKTVIKKDVYNGYPFISIHEIKDDKELEKPIVSFGLKKARAILQNIDEINDFVDANTKES